MKKKDKTLNNYIEIARMDIIVYLVMSIIIFIGLLILGAIVHFYLILLMEIIILFPTLFRIDAYFNLKKIKIYLVENKLIDKIGKIDYWNEKNYFLTENYMIIKNKDVNVFTYNEITAIYKETQFKLGGTPRNQSYYNEYLHIMLGEKDFKVLTYSTILIDEEYKEIKEYLLDKNSNIEVLDTLKK